MPATNLGHELKKIDQRTMADLVEEQVRVYLRKKMFRPGDALPSEQQMADSLGVSRNVVREALSRLRMLGIVETKKKRGMLLSSPDILSPMERMMDPIIMEKSTLQDLFEFRLTLEVGFADLLFKRKKVADIDDLEAIANKQKLTSGKPAFRIQHEIAFHGKLYQMTGNQTMQRFQTMLLPIFGYVMEVEKEYKPAEVSHLDLVQLLRGSSKEKFRQGMIKHLEHHFESLV